MACKVIGDSTLCFANPPVIIGSAAIGGKKEGEGPLGNSFDLISQDTTFGEKTWEKAERALQKEALSLAVGKAKISDEQLSFILAGDLINQCIASAFAVRGRTAPFIGLYGACSTMAESLALSAVLIDGGFADYVAAVTSSHFCSAEKQYRFPLEYGGQRTPTSQWTATASGAAILSCGGSGPKVKKVRFGKIVDYGITDANNMGAAMAPAAYDTISGFFKDTGTTHENYDLILTGDLGMIGKEILIEAFASDGLDIKDRYDDCGAMIYDALSQDTHAGGSGCGCGASVLCGHILNGMRECKWSNVLFCATGALLSPVSSQQGESIPSVCHVVEISR